MDFRFKRLTAGRQFHVFLYWFIRLYSLTFRVIIENEQEWMDYVRGGGRVILCTWHQQFFCAIRHFQKYKIFRPALMISRSRDGEMIAAVAERSGWIAVRGSSSNRGKHALYQMIEHLKGSRLAAHVLDGPQGPAGRIKAGIITMAHSAEAAVVPFYTRADRSWFFKSWDNFFLPKPFARVTISFDKIIILEKTDNEEAFEAQRRRLEQLMLPPLRVTPHENRNQSQSNDRRTQIVRPENVS
ncbi:MAG: lysophospholipid acyltransferase family protein [Syntrophaceae bacterium]